MDIEEFKKKSIGNQIRNLREDMGMTLKQFSEDLGSFHSTVQNIEKGRNYPSFKLVENLYYVYGLSVSDMLETAYAEITEEQETLASEEAIERSERNTNDQ